MVANSDTDECRAGVVGVFNKASWGEIVTVTT